MENFIKTQSEEVAKELRYNGFTELPKNGNFFVFLNDSRKNFSAQKNKDVVLTNVLTF